MKVYLLSLVVFFTASVLKAQGIHFVKNKTWKEVVALAKKENKLIFLDAYTSWCGPCKYMQNEVFQDPVVGRFFNNHFINVKLDMEKGEGLKLDKELKVTAYPTLFFIDGNGKPVHKYVGTLEPDELKAFAKEALNSPKQYFTIKEKAKTGDVPPQIFDDWIHSAETMEDKDMDEVTMCYFKTTTYPLAEYHMLTLFMDHATFITESQLSYFYKEQNTIAAITVRTHEQVNTAFRKMLTSYAVLKSEKADSIDFGVLKSILSQYPPVNSELETRKVRIGYLRDRGQAAKAIDELVALIADPKSGINVQELFSIVVENASEIVTSGRAEELVHFIEAYPVTAAEKAQSFYKELAVLSIDVARRDKNKIRQYAMEVLKNDNAEYSIKKEVNKILSEYDMDLNDKK